MNSATAMPPESKRPPYWKLFLLACALVAISVILLPRSYAEADDPSMVDFLQNGFLVSFMSVTASRFLSFLYAKNHSIPWYALYHWGFLSICLSLTWQQILSIRLPKTITVFFLSLFSIVFLAFITRLTFTYTSILLGGVSVIGLSHFLYQAMSRDEVNPSRTRIWKEPLLYGTLLAASFLTRWEGLKTLIFFIPFLLVFTASGISVHLKTLPLTLKEWTFSKDFFRSLNKLTSILCCFLAPLLVAATIEKCLPITDAEQKFDQFMHAHEDNIGFGISNIRQQKNFLKKLHWSEADYEMYQHWLYIDENTFSTRHMEMFSSLTKPMIAKVMLETFQPAEFIKSILKTIDNGFFKKRQMAFTFLAAFLLALALSANATKAKKAIPWALLIYLFALTWVMEVFLRFPLRVAGPIFYLSALSMLMLPVLNMKQPSFLIASLSKWQKVLCILVVVISIIPIVETIYQTKQIVKKQKLFKEEYAFLRKITAPDGYLLRESGLVGIKWLDPVMADIPIIPESSAGWTIFSPPYYERLALRHLSHASEILPWMINRPNALLLINAKRVPIVEQYLWEHYRIKAKLRPKTHLPKKPTAIVYQLVTP